MVRVRDSRRYSRVPGARVRSSKFTDEIRRWGPASNNGEAQPVRMPRTVRVQYEGAYYHVFSRGNRRERIYWYDKDYNYGLKAECSIDGPPFDKGGGGGIFSC